MLRQAREELEKLEPYLPIIKQMSPRLQRASTGKYPAVVVDHETETVFVIVGERVYLFDGISPIMLSLTEKLHDAVEKFPGNPQAQVVNWQEITKEIPELVSSKKSRPDKCRKKGRPSTATERDRVRKRLWCERKKLKARHPSFACVFVGKRGANGGYRLDFSRFRPDSSGFVIQ